MGRHNTINYEDLNLNYQLLNLHAQYKLETYTNSQVRLIVIQ
jgi:hypothetical protein